MCKYIKKKMTTIYDKECLPDAALDKYMTWFENGNLIQSLPDDVLEIMIEFLTPVKKHMLSVYNIDKRIASKNICKIYDRELTENEIYSAYNHIIKIPLVLNFGKYSGRCYKMMVKEAQDDCRGCAQTQCVYWLKRNGIFMKRGDKLMQLAEHVLRRYHRNESLKSYRAQYHWG